MLKSFNVNVNIENKNGLIVFDVVVLVRREGSRWGCVERMVKWYGGKCLVFLVKIKIIFDIFSFKLIWCELR